MGDAASKIDWLEAFESVVKSFRAHDLEEWELHQLRSRIDAAIIAERRAAVSNVLDEALNSGDGSYRP